MTCSTTKSLRSVKVRQVSQMIDCTRSARSSISSTRTCNIRLIRPTQLDQLAKNLILRSFLHKSCYFYINYCIVLYCILNILSTFSGVKHLVLSQYAISSRSNNLNSRKWPKIYFLALWIIQKCIYVTFE